jgi:GxxExxY protein
MSELIKPFNEKDFLLQQETRKIIGTAMEIHRILGRGLLEIVYKDALEYEFKNRNIFYEREKEYTVKYKDIILSHKFYADFVAFDSIIIEIKAQKGIIDEHYAQTLNYLAISKCKVGLILNFGESSLQFKRLVLTK